MSSMIKQKMAISIETKLSGCGGGLLFHVHGQLSGTEQLKLELGMQLQCLSGCS